MDRDGFIELLRRAQGSETQKEFAERMGISPQYLNHVLTGKTEPGEGVLRPMGVKKVVSYEKEGPYTKDEESTNTTETTYAEIGDKAVRIQRKTEPKTRDESTATNELTYIRNEDE